MDEEDNVLISKYKITLPNGNWPYLEQGSASQIEDLARKQAISCGKYCPDIKNDVNWIYLSNWNAVDGTNGRHFDLQNGALGTIVGTKLTLSSISELDDDGYRKVSITLSSLSEVGSGWWYIFSTEADNDTYFTGDGSTVSTYMKETLLAQL